MKTFLIRLFFPNYLKLKSENKALELKNQQLTRDIETLVRNEDETAVLEIKIHWGFKMRVEKLMNHGEGTDNRLQGLITDEPLKSL